MPTKQGSGRPKGVHGGRTSAMTPETTTTKVRNRVESAKPARNRNRTVPAVRSRRGR